MASDNTITGLEQGDALAARGASAPRVSLADMTAAIDSVHFINAGDAVERTNVTEEDGAPASLHLMTLCFITMRNGFVVVGKSAPAHPENYDAGKGKQFAKEDAMRRIWPLMGFSLRDRLQLEAQTGQAPK